MNDTLDEITRASADLLRNNRVHSTMDGQPFRYTRPAPSTYEQQWLWDSCFHAIALRWLDPAMAWDELRAVVAHAIPDGPDAGMLPHMTYWDGGGEALWSHPNRSFITQPPLVAVAAMAVAARSSAAEAVAPLRVYPPSPPFTNGWIAGAIRTTMTSWSASIPGRRAGHRLASIRPWTALSERRFPTTDCGGRLRLTALCNTFGCDPVALRDARYYVEQVATTPSARPTSRPLSEWRPARISRR
jgi:hypothetical protein